MTSCSWLETSLVSSTRRENHLCVRNSLTSDRKTLWPINLIDYFVDYLRRLILAGFYPCNFFKYMLWHYSQVRTTSMVIPNRERSCLSRYRSAVSCFIKILLVAWTLLTLRRETNLYNSARIPLNQCLYSSQSSKKTSCNFLK